MRLVTPFTCCFLVLTLSCTKPRELKTWTDEWEGGKLKIEMIVDSIRVPFALAFLPNGEMLVTDRPAGQLLKVDIESGKKTVIKGLPSIYAAVDGGMLDVLPHPDFKNNHWLYYSFSILEDTLSTMVVERAKLIDDSLTQREQLFKASPSYQKPNHFGNRLVLKDGYLFFGMGDRYYLRDSAQTLSSHLGKMIRIYEDGRVPEDNPFAKTRGAKPEIWSYGHRNPQGLTLHPVTGELWEHEHGPKGGDEVNIIQPGLNYGWPVICWGIDYDGNKIGEGITHHEGMEQPLYHYTPSIAPSGMEFYTASEIPSWKGNLFIGAMALKHLNRLVLDGTIVVKEERILAKQGWRVRSVRQGPDGMLYLGVDGGMVVRVSTM